MMKRLILAGLLAAAVQSPAMAAGEAKNVIFFLGDGMGPVTVTAARIYKYGEAGTLTMETLGRTARVKTYSNDAQTTDSAPSMAAYMTGVKMNNEVLSMTPDTLAGPYAPGKDTVTGVAKSINNCPATGNGTAVKTILEMAIEKGKATGAVTTTRLTHATPAATFSHVCHRDTEYEISRQAVPGGAGFNPALGNGIDVLLGGISQYWTPYNAVSNKAGRPDGRDLTAELKAKGYTYATDRTSLLAAPVTAGSKLIGLFDFAVAQGHMSYELDRDPTKEPSLAEMTSKAIDILSKNDKGYFLMVEGGRIDHALHGTNAKRALEDTIAFDNAIKAALAKVDLSNTLIVVTADHDHTMVFNGYSKRGNPILDISRSYVDNSPNKDADGNTYTTLVFGKSPNRPATRVNVDSAVALDQAYLQEGAFRCPSPGCESHGGGDVFLFAKGAGAAPFKGTIDNTKVFTLLKSALGF